MENVWMASTTIKYVFLMFSAVEIFRSFFIPFEPFLAFKKFLDFQTFTLSSRFYSEMFQPFYFLFLFCSVVVILATLDETARSTLTSALAILVRMAVTALMWWLATNASVPVDSMVLGASPTLMNAPLSPVSTVVFVRMDSTNTYANAKMVTKGNAAKIKLIYANPIRVNTEANATPFSTLIPANVNPALKAKTARLILMIVYSGLVRTMVLVLIISMISSAFANLPSLARPAKKRWTLASATTAPMEPLAPQPPTTKTILAPVLWDSPVDFAKKTLMSVR